MSTTAFSAGPIALSVTIDVASEQAFNALWEEVKEKVLTAYGAIVMRQARGSIKPSKRSSQPGSPPHSHMRALEHSIRFAYDRDTGSMVAGPILLSGKPGTAPAALERGGHTQAVRYRSIQTITIEPRPFMGPALVATESRLPSLWENSLKT